MSAEIFFSATRPPETSAPTLPQSVVVEASKRGQDDRTQRQRLRRYHGKSQRRHEQRDDREEGLLSTRQGEQS
ncbi:hypothetical protein [Pseudomonas urmiensis]|jgi:hypothetical protein|uniref:hypothetical protein n=1 Tax=Pseudomonas urmiensis TaxID=2745493 RepID=UPI003D098143